MLEQKSQLQAFLNWNFLLGKLKTTKLALFTSKSAYSRTNNRVTLVFVFEIALNFPLSCKHRWKATTATTLVETALASTKKGNKLYQLSSKNLGEVKQLRAPEKYLCNEEGEFYSPFHVPQVNIFFRKFSAYLKRLRTGVVINQCDNVPRRAVVPLSEVIERLWRGSIDGVSANRSMSEKKYDFIEGGWVKNYVKLNSILSLSELTMERPW